MFFWLYIIGSFGVLIWSYLAGDANWFLALINSFRYFLFLPLILFWIEKLWMGIEKFPLFLMTLLTGLFIYFYIWFPFYEGFDKSKVIVFKGEPIRIMTFNILVVNPNTEAVIQTIRQSKAQIVALQEITPQRANALKTQLKDLYPFNSGSSGRGVVDTMILSSYPIAKVQEIPLESGNSQLVLIQTPAKLIPLVNIHTESIDPLDVFGDQENIFRAYKRREKSFEEIINYLKRSGINLNEIIMAGDFNSTEGNQTYKIMKSAGLIDSYRDVNPILPNAFTFPHNMQGLFKKSSEFWPLLRIDYIFAGSSYKCTQSEVIHQKTGSDHKPLISTFGIK